MTTTEQTFASVLVPGGATLDGEPSQPDCFGDLHLDQVVAAVTAERDEYDLVPFFHQPLRTEEEVGYRHEVLHDLEQDATLELVRRFAAALRDVRRQLKLSSSLHHSLQRQRWFLSAASDYRDAIARLRADLDAAPIRSAALTGLRGHVRGYAESGEFQRLATDADAVTDALEAVRYDVQLKGARVRVSRETATDNLTEAVEETFERFRQGATKSYRVRFRDHAELNHVEEQILELVAQLHPETFAALEAFGRNHATAFDETILRFDREIQFYLAYLEHLDRLRERGLSFCVPEVLAGAREVGATEAFDLALAAKLTTTTHPDRDADVIVPNDFRLSAPERVLVVSGPNQGGKTTFARTVGQLHYLAELGLPVPGRTARLALVDGLFTHFEREESVETLRGKFEDELVRIRDILERATAESLLVMNESFGSTTLQDAVEVGSEIVRQVVDLGALCVFVTFVDELASLSDATVSMMSTVDPEDPARRTFRIERKPADGLAYAAALAEKYGLTYERLKERLSR